MTALLGFDPDLVFHILLFGAVFTAAQAGSGLLQSNQVRRTVNRRLAVQERGVALSEVVLELRKQRGLSAGGDRAIRFAWFSDLVLRSGAHYRPRRWAIAAAGLGLFIAVAIRLAWGALLPGIAAGALAAIGAPLLTLHVLAARRAAALSRQLPDALDVIVRSLEAGHPVPTAIALVGREMRDPIGSEFGMMSDEIAFGATLEAAAGHLADRCRHPDVDLFAATIRLQDRSGGNLTGLLRMNAHTVRERLKLRLKIRAAASEGRVSAIILTSAPIAVFVLLLGLSPHYYGDVWDEPAIRWGLGLLGAWMLIGNLVMRRMIAMRI